MKLVSFNVNGLRACITKGFVDTFNNFDADIFAVQETKMQEDQLDLEINGYYRYMSSAIKKGYSGTLVYTKVKPLNVIYGIDGMLYNDEGRVITLEFDNFYFVCAYVPNSQPELKRLDYRMQFENDMRNFLSSLKEKKPVIYTGDLNVAHEPIDLANPEANTKNPGFSNEEREKMSLLLNSGFTDTFRYLYPNLKKYSWWSYRFNARMKNIGWRIDYFLVSNDIKDKVIDSKIHNDILGSDHCPVELDINI